MEEILNDVRSGTNQIVFYHDNGTKELTPLATNTVEISNGVVHVFYTKYPNISDGKLDIPLEKLELVTQYE